MKTTPIATYEVVEDIPPFVLNRILPRNQHRFFGYIRSNAKNKHLRRLFSYRFLMTYKPLHPLYSFNFSVSPPLGFFLNHWTKHPNIPIEWYWWHPYPVPAPPDDNVLPGRSAPGCAQWVLSELVNYSHLALCSQPHHRPGGGGDFSDTTIVHIL